MTHEERLELIHRPFFIINMGPSYPHGGTAVADNFYSNNEEWAERSNPENQGETGSARGSKHMGWILISNRHTREMAK